MMRTLSLQHVDATSSHDQSIPQILRPECLRVHLPLQDIVRLVRLLQDTRATLIPEVSAEANRNADRQP